MTPDVESTSPAPLDRALDAIDGARRRVAAAFIFFYLLALGGLLWFTYVLRTSTNLKAALSAAVVAIVFVVCVSAATVAIHMTRMTRRILIAIEISMMEHHDRIRRDG